MSTDRRIVSLAEVITHALDKRSAAIRVALPAKIVKFYPDTQLADVKPLVQEEYEAEDGTDILESLPVITNVPVQFPGSAGFVLTFPVAPGDFCLLVFADRSIDKWLTSGEDADPVAARRHDLSDAVALLGVRPGPAALATFDTNRAFFGSTEDTSSGVGVAVDLGSVHLGVTPNEAATFAIALASKVEAEISALRTWASTHTHATVTSLGTPTPPVAPGPPAVGDTSSPTVLAKG